MTTTKRDDGSPRSRVGSVGASGLVRVCSLRRRRPIYFALSTRKTFRSTAAFEPRRRRRVSLHDHVHAGTGDGAIGGEQRRARARDVWRVRARRRRPGHRRTFRVGPSALRLRRGYELSPLAARRQEPGRIGRRLFGARPASGGEATLRLVGRGGWDPVSFSCAFAKPPRSGIVRTTSSSFSWSVGLVPPSPPSPGPRTRHSVPRGGTRPATRKKTPRADCARVRPNDRPPCSAEAACRTFSARRAARDCWRIPPRRLAVPLAAERSSPRRASSAFNARH